MAARVLTAAVAGLAAAVATSSAAGAPPVRIVHEQLGLTRQVSVGDRTIAWTRCLGAPGPTEVWTAPLRGGRATRVPGLRVPGACEPLTLVGAVGERVAVLISGTDGLRRLALVNRRTGARTVLDTETAGDDGTRIVSADLNGVNLVWLHEAGAGNARSTDVTLVDVRRPTQRRVLYTRSLVYNAVRPIAVWAGASGSAVVRELLSGALYGYGEREERAVLVDGVTAPRQVARVSGGTTLVAGDLAARWFVYSMARPGDRRVWVVAYHLGNRTRRVVRLAPLIPGGADPRTPAVPAPSIWGDLVAWRERRRVGGGFRDRVVALNLARRAGSTVFALTDSRGQRLFISQPSVRAGRVGLAEVRLSTAYGVPGGFMGETPVGARSSIRLARLR